MIFNIDENVAFNSILSALEMSGQHLTDKAIDKVLNTIENSLPGILGAMMAETQEEWISEALESETGWGGKYAQAIKMKVEKDGGTVYLDETVIDKGSNKPAFMFAMMVEQGISSWSIKDALLKSEKAKVGPAGIKYIIVPFNVATPSAGKNGKLDRKFGGRQMDKATHDLVKNGGTAPAGTTVTVKNSIRSFTVDISGLSKYITPKFHSSYAMFRCVSEKSVGWIYPNKSKRPVFPSIISYVNRRIQEELTKFCEEVVKENS